jgi:hypothetical protein
MMPSLVWAGSKPPQGVLVLTLILSAFLYTGASVLVAYLNNLRDEKKTQESAGSAENAIGSR